MLQYFDMARYPVDSADSVHLQIEAMKIAFADVYRYVSDPRTMTVRYAELLDPAYLAARALHVPSVVKLFGVMDLADERLSRVQRVRRQTEMLVALRFPHDAWIVLDDGTRGDQALSDRGVPAARIHFLPNGVNLEWLNSPSNPEWLPERYGIVRYAYLVLYAARLVDWKRADAFVRVAARVRAQMSRRVAFVVAGDGPERARCEALARSLEMGDDIYFVGAIPHAHIPDAMATAIHLTPSSAGALAARARAKRLVLTHLYPPVEGVDILGAVGAVYGGPAVVAGDGDRFEIADG